MTGRSSWWMDLPTAVPLVEGEAMALPRAETGRRSAAPGEKAVDAGHDAARIAANSVADNSLSIEFPLFRVP